METQVQTESLKGLNSYSKFLCRTRNAEQFQVKPLESLDSLIWGNKVMIRGIKHLKKGSWSYLREKENQLEFVTPYILGRIASLKINKDSSYVSNLEINVKDKPYSLSMIDRFDENNTEYQWFIREATITGDPITHLIALGMK